MDDCAVPLALGLLACLTVPGSAEGAFPFHVDCAYYHVDVGGGYAWAENAPGLTDFAETDRRAGLLKAYVQNSTDQPARVEATALDGTPLDELRTGQRHEVIWWRTWPTPVPPHGYGEVSVRLRYPQTTDARLSLTVGGQSTEVVVPATPPSFRIETVAWAEGGRQATLVAQEFGEGDRTVERVFLDGVDVTNRARLLAPGFAHGVCPLELRLDEPLEVGSFHTYKLAASNGETVACTLRTLDEFMRLGMYGASDLERNVKLGLNCAAHFRALSRDQLDRYADFGQRSAFHVGGEGPEKDVRGHPAVHGYLLHDEPDCWDYTAKEWPVGMRIGFHGMDIVRNTQACVEADPVKPVMATLDLTFKPSNYYVYAQIPDIVAPDCYPLSIGVPLAWVREVTDACRKAAGPRRVEAIPQVDFEDRKKKEMKFRRPPFAGEVLIQYLYALGAGARGFSGWEWFDEDSDFAHFHGAPNYPDVLNAVGQVFRRLDLLAPLILKAHPTDLATCSEDKVWVKTLVCGGDALLLVIVNDDYACLPTDFRHRPKSNVVIDLPPVPWLRPGYAAEVGEGSFASVALQQSSEVTRITLPSLDTGAIVVVAADEGLADTLLTRYTAQQARAGRALLRGYRRGEAAEARRAELERVIVGRFAKYAVDVSSPLAAYGIEAEGFWNPSGAKYPGIEWWTEDTPRGGEWKVTIPAEQAGNKHTVYFQRERWWGGGYLRVEVAGPDGNVLLEQDRPAWAGPIPHFEVTFPAAGEYTLRILQTGEGKPGGRLARVIYVVPEGVLETLADRGEDATRMRRARIMRRYESLRAGDGELLDRASLPP